MVNVISMSAVRDGPVIKTAAHVSLMRCIASDKDDAQPGETSAHGSGPYSAFLRDPDGHDIEITVSQD